MTTDHRRSNRPECFDNSDCAVGLMDVRMLGGTTVQMTEAIPRRELQVQEPLAPGWDVKQGPAP